MALQLVSATRKWISELKFSYNIFIVKDNFVSSLNGMLKISGSVLKMLEIGMGRQPIHCVDSAECCYMWGDNVAYCANP